MVCQLMGAVYSYWLPKLFGGSRTLKRELEVRKMPVLIACVSLCVCVCEREKEANPLREA